MNPPRAVLCVITGLSLALAAGEARAQPKPGPGKALRFDSQAGELCVRHTAAFETAAMTIELWARLDGPQAEHAQFVRKLNSWDKPGFLLAASQSGYRCVQFRWWSGGLRTLPDSLLATWYDQEWHHFAAVYTPRQVTLYVDGVEVARRESKDAGPLAFDAEAPLRIGAEGFTGEIDELRIWSRARGLSELRGAMYRPISPTEQDLLAYWRFDDPEAKDLGPNHLAFENSGDLGPRLRESGAPLARPDAIKKHKERAEAIAKGRGEVEAVAKRLPPLNAAIYRFATSLAGEPFGNGDCWNFVDQAMHMAGARRRDIYIFGDEVAAKEALPGDLIQFEKFSSPTFGSDHHSAILWKNDGGGAITVIHQNAPPNGKNAGVWEIDLRNSTGEIKFFRPTE